MRECKRREAPMLGRARGLTRKPRSETTFKKKNLWEVTPDRGGQVQTSWGSWTWLHSGWSRSNRGWWRRRLLPGCSAPSPCLLQRRMHGGQPEVKQSKQIRGFHPWKSKHSWKTIRKTKTECSWKRALNPIDYFIMAAAIKYIYALQGGDSSKSKQNVLLF